MSEPHSASTPAPGSQNQDSQPATPAEPSARVVPGGTIIGYGPRVEPAGWTVKEKIRDGFPPVPDVAPPLALGERGWAIVGASRIGRGHLQDGKYREDAIAGAIVDG